MVQSYSPGCANLPPSNTCFRRLTRVHSPNGRPISIGSAILVQLTADCRRTCPGMSFPLKFLLRMGISTPPNNASLGPPESTTQTAFIGSAVLAQLTAEYPYTDCTVVCPFPLKIAQSHGDLDSYVIHGSLGPPESSTQTASRSVRPFLQGSLV